MACMQQRIRMGGARLPRIVIVALIAILGVLFWGAGAASAATNCSAGSTLITVAHEDDSLLFLSPDLIHAINNGRCVRTVFFTAGDAGMGQSYWSSREQGVEAAYAQMAGVPDTWTQADAGIAGHPMPVMTLSGQPNISLVFMRLPDGNIDGSGFASTGYVSLQKLYTGTIPQMTAVDGSSSYTLKSLNATVSSLITSFKPDTIWTQDYAGTYGDGDHSDHHTVAYITREASREWTTTTHTLTGYMDYTTLGKAANVTGSDLTAKENAWFAYTPFDSQVCGSASTCQNTNYWSWLSAEYTVGTETDGPGQTYPPTAHAGPDQTVQPGATTQLDGSASTDPGGNPTYQWTQTAGPSVSLSSTSSVSPTFTAPPAATTLTFQLVVTDGSQTSAADTVTISVTGGANDIALQATATASSQAAGQPASAAIDGVVGGYPNQPSNEWSTNGGRAGSWLKLTWSSPQTINEVVLYDRPNLSDQVTGGTLTFSDGSTVPVPALNNDGTATVVTFPAKTTTTLLFTVTSVSSTTTNVGLAEIMVFPAGGGGTTPITANAGPNQVVSTGATVQLDGSGSYDPGTNTSYQWTQTAGPSVTLSSATAVKPTFTAPSSATTITFQLVVSDGSSSSQASSVTITVNAATTNIAPLATVTASSQDTATGQTAAKAVDGVIDGYPGNYLAEWATTGGVAGSWLNLAWSSPQTINEVILYDRPNLSDQVTGGTLTFSDGSTVNVPALNNDGSATTVTFPAKTTTSLLFTVTSVSSTTQNVGLAEIQVYPSGGSTPLTADAGSNQSVATNATVTLDGSGSYDPGNNPVYKWTQTAGTSVTLSSATAVKPSFTAPSTATALTFQLVVTDGSQTSQPSSVNITVTPVDLALNATATASSQNTADSQTANKAIDGVIDGYPGDYTKEWATVGGVAGSWLNLAWTTPQTISKVVLYDRPNLNDQVTGGTLTFSDGSTVTVPALNNDGSATTVTFPSKTTTSLLFTVTSVSSTTQNVGLSEIQAYQ